MAEVSIDPCRFTKIKPLRTLFLQELNAQVRYDAAHTRTGTTEYLIRHQSRDIGYAEAGLKPCATSDPSARLPLGACRTLPMKFGPTRGARGDTGVQSRTEVTLLSY